MRSSTRSSGRATIRRRLADWVGGRRRRGETIAEPLWRRVVTELPLYDGLAGDDVARLRELTGRFLAEKRFFGAHGFEVTDYMRVAVAAQACRLALHLGYEYLRACRTIILYPEGFVAERESLDEDGILHTGFEELDGEAMYGGAVVLAWEEARPWRGEDDVFVGNVVVHEFAHKIDELTGDHNGLPPLRRGMSVRSWSAAFSAAYEDLCATVDAGQEAPIDDYAAADPAEFFSVTVETFFLAPGLLEWAYPAVYGCLSEFFDEDPAGVRAEAGR